jgi:hypothetical protein
MKLKKDEYWLPNWKYYYSINIKGEVFKYESNKRTKLTLTKHKTTKASYVVSIKNFTHNWVTLYASVFVPNPNNYTLAKIINNKKLISPDNVRWVKPREHNIATIKNIYSNMIARCYNKNHIRYKNWGGRGIKVCDRWLNSFDDFYNDMGIRPTRYTLDRIDVDGDYEPSNCRWVDQKAQMNNKTNNKNITFNGKTQTLKMWAEELGFCRTTLQERIKKGMSEEEALTKLVDKTHSHRY